VTQAAQQFLFDDPSYGWNSIDASYDGVDYCYTKISFQDKERNEVYVTKAYCHISGATCEDIFSVYWDTKQELVWNSNTVAHIQVLQNNGYDQLIFAQHKTTSAVTAKNDVLYRRVAEKQSDHITVYSVSERNDSAMREQTGWRRGTLVMGCFLIESDGNGCKVSYLYSWAFNGMIHQKFIDEEQKKVPLRLSKIKKIVQDNIRNKQQLLEQQRQQQQQQQKQQQQQQRQQQQQQQPQTRAPVNEAPTPGVKRMCPQCKVTGIVNFCGYCGTSLSPHCGMCHSPCVEGFKFCGKCGNPVN